MKPTRQHAPFRGDVDRHRSEQFRELLHGLCALAPGEEDLERMAQLDASAHGAVLKTKHGNLIQNPLVGVVNTLRRDMQRWASEFGPSP